MSFILMKTALQGAISPQPNKSWPQGKSINFKNKMAKKSAKEAEVEQFVDAREPKITFPLILMIRIVGWEIVWILIGMVGYACFGSLPLIFNVLIGELILSLTSTTSTDYTSTITSLTTWMAIIAGIASILTW